MTLEIETGFRIFFVIGILTIPILYWFFARESGETGQNPARSEGEPEKRNGQSKERDDESKQCDDGSKERVGDDDA